MTLTKHAIRQRWLMRFLFAGLVFCALPFVAEYTASAFAARMNEQFRQAIQDSGLTGMAGKFEDAQLIIGDLR